MFIEYTGLTLVCLNKTTSASGGARIKAL